MLVQLLPRTDLPPHGLLDRLGLVDEAGDAGEDVSGLEPPRPGQHRVPALGRNDQHCGRVATAVFQAAGTAAETAEPAPRSKAVHT
eukprot:SAG22_NODE_15181_length_355_cov_0.593750_1_plen_85_part_01